MGTINLATEGNVSTTKSSTINTILVGCDLFLVCNLKIYNLYQPIGGLANGTPRNWWTICFLLKIGPSLTILPSTSEPSASGTTGLLLAVAQTQIQEMHAKVSRTISWRSYWRHKTFPKKQLVVGALIKWLAGISGVTESDWSVLKPQILKPGKPHAWVKNLHHKAIDLAIIFTLRVCNYSGQN